ncbi:MAG: hypothetical protein ACTSU9_10375, partial [Promethearchaeota archaeon]
GVELGDERHIGPGNARRGVCGAAPAGARGALRDPARRGRFGGDAVAVAFPRDSLPHRCGED